MLCIRQSCNYCRPIDIMERFYNGWEEVFLPEFEKPYFAQLKQFILSEYKSKHVFPPSGKIFNAFDLTAPDEVKVVILGQDPYPTAGNAMGLSFSVPKGVMRPPSLVNIMQEIESNLGHKSIIEGGDLTPWAEQGVLLLNTVMTVVEGMPNSHKNKGWETFTDCVISYLNELDTEIVFLLWGNNAIAKKKLLTNPDHLVLTAPHPSPLSAYQGFYGCKHFSKANEYLEQFDHHIDW